MEFCSSHVLVYESDESSHDNDFIYYEEEENDDQEETSTSIPLVYQSDSIQFLSNNFYYEVNELRREALVTTSIDTNRDFNYNFDNEYEKMYKQNSVSHFNSEIPIPSHLNELEVPNLNIIGVNLNNLVDKTNETFAGEPHYCATCSAIVSCHSLIELNQWICEFCGYKNTFQIDSKEVPCSNDITYLIEPSVNYQNSVLDDSLIVFCIDTSGSMNVTKQIDGFLPLKTKINNGNLSETHISRLECVQFAIEQNLEKLRTDNPNRRVVLITFNDQITIIGDGTQDSLIIEPDRVEIEEDLNRICELFKYFKPIKDTKKHLEEKLYHLEANGATALGPALILSLKLASQKQGSQVILCTDGIANIGIGNFEESFEESVLFYEKLSLMALSMSTSVSVITIKGTGCKLSIIGQMAHKTNGIVEVVDQLELKQQLKEILDKNEIKATNVQLKLISHKCVSISSSNNKNYLTQFIGNLSKNCELSFEYSVKGTREDIEKLTQIPFQLQISYQTRDGSRLLKVLTETKPFTYDQLLAETNCSIELLAKHTLSSQAKLLSDNLNSNKKLNTLKCEQKLKAVSAYLNKK